jgi:hypothetical protein
VPALPGQQILELKFRHHTPAVFKQLVEEFGLIPQRASKYRLGMGGERPGSGRGTERTPWRLHAGTTASMPDFLAGTGAASRETLGVFVRLVIAMLLGAVWRWSTGDAIHHADDADVHRDAGAAHHPDCDGHQVIGDNVARAFSLVGALSIVRFRTVVRDTQDTAYVIFAVAVGMAVGAARPAGRSAIAVVGFAAYVMRERTGETALAVIDDPYVLQVRVGVGADPNTLLGPTLDLHLRGRRLQSVATPARGWRSTSPTRPSSAAMMGPLNWSRHESAGGRPERDASPAGCGSGVTAGDRT